jgi:ribosomal protein S18 acetylase RimI-like enzyme
MSATLEVARAQEAEFIEVSTSEDDVGARALYESFGFINREQGPEGPLMYMYEREL